MQKRPDRFESARFALSAAAAHINGEIDLHRAVHALERQDKGRSVTCSGQVLLWDGNRQDYRRRARARRARQPAPPRARRTDACATHRGRAARSREGAGSVARAGDLFTEDGSATFGRKTTSPKRHGGALVDGGARRRSRCSPRRTCASRSVHHLSSTTPKVRRRRCLPRARARERHARERERTTRATRRRRRRRRARRRIRRSRAETRRRRRQRRRKRGRRRRR